MILKVKLHSFLADKINDYINYKRAMARKFDNEEHSLRLLDRYLFKNQRIKTIRQLKPAIINDFLNSRQRANSQSYNLLLGIVRCFFNWLVSQEWIDRSPVTARPKKTTLQYVPFIFKNSEVMKLLKLASLLPSKPNALHRSEIYSLIFTLMYGMGLRVGEVSRLLKEDIDMDRKLLIIRNTKFSKNRLVPFGPRLEIKLSIYMKQRETWSGPWKHDSPLFSFSDDYTLPIGKRTISRTFRLLLPKLHLSVPPGVSQPRLHCLRHSFAVASLLRWYKSGLNPSRRLFHLSTFMGHADPSSTAWYLTITDELLQEANLRFERLICSKNGVDTL